MQIALRPAPATEVVLGRSPGAKVAAIPVDKGRRLVRLVQRHCRGHHRPDPDLDQCAP